MFGAPTFITQVREDGDAVVVETRFHLDKTFDEVLRVHADGSIVFVDQGDARIAIQQRELEPLIAALQLLRKKLT